MTWINYFGNTFCFRKSNSTKDGEVSGKPATLSTLRLEKLTSYLLIAFLDRTIPRYFTSDLTSIEERMESVEKWMGSSSHFLTLRVNPEALEKIEIDLRATSTMNLSFKRSAVSSAN